MGSGLFFGLTQIFFHDGIFGLSNSGSRWDVQSSRGLRS